MHWLMDAALCVLSQNSRREDAAGWGNVLEPSIPELFLKKSAKFIVFFLLSGDGQCSLFKSLHLSRVCKEV